MDAILQDVHDENLRLCLSFGIGLHHAGIGPLSCSAIK